ncbi:hypothetical protein HIM_01474 [Hirsutella minnesotensis 3608]|nr:hypothetical protein HIM_01474 [Hirsutella minnesotensis 3608]
MGFRITTWNVNGIRNPFAYPPWRERRTFQAMFEILEADIVVMQETKIQRKDLQDDMVLIPGWDVYFSLPRHKKGYSGVAIYTRNATCSPIRAEEGVTGVLCAPKSSVKFRDLPESQRIGGYPRPGQLSGNVDDLELDSEGRCVILEFPAFVLFGVYSPANRNESRDDFRLGFLEALDVRIRNLVAEGKHVILTGDLNVIRSEKDTTNLLETLRKEGMSLDDWISLPSRRIFNQLIFEGHVIGKRDDGREIPVLWDLCRCFHPQREGMNTCWDTKRNTRPANNGSRIDYVLCSDGIKNWFTGADIQEGLMGSDHCPVFATMGDTVHLDERESALADVVNRPGMFVGGQQLRAWSQKDVLPLSAKLIPEFDRRQSIRDMFSKKSGPVAIGSTASDRLSTGTHQGCVLPQLQERRADEKTGNISNALPREVRANNHSALVRGSQDQPPHDSQSASESERSASTKSIDNRLVKRAKIADSRSSKTKSNSGQKTLRGFFKSATPRSVAIPRNSSGPPQQTDEATRSLRSELAPAPRAPELDSGTMSTSPATPRQTSSNVRSVAQNTGDIVFDPIEAKESWSKLLGRRAPPRCEHSEPCISLVTKKAGVNCGRSFYICPRPLGPSGEKEKGSEWRCGTFIWSSDWNGSAL